MIPHAFLILVGQVATDSSVSFLSIGAISAIAAGAVGYGVVKAKGDAAQHELRAMRKDLNDINERLARIEGWMERDQARR